MGILGAPVSTDAADADVAASPFFAAFVFRLPGRVHRLRAPRRGDLRRVAARRARRGGDGSRARVHPREERGADAFEPRTKTLIAEAADVVGSRAGFESYHDQIYARGDQTEAKGAARADRPISEVAGVAGGGRGARGRSPRTRRRSSWRT